MYIAKIEVVLIRYADHLPIGAAVNCPQNRSTGAAGPRNLIVHHEQPAKAGVYTALLPNDNIGAGKRGTLVAVRGLIRLSDGNPYLDR